MPGLLSAYFGRLAAGRAALRLPRPAVARPADLAGFLATFWAGFLAALFTDFFTAFLATFAAASLAAFTVLRAAAFFRTGLDALSATGFADARAVVDALDSP